MSTMTSKELNDKLEALADNFNIPSITIWKQGKFIDHPKYSHMDEHWVEEQKLRERTLIRPGGMTHNALFQVSSSGEDANIAEYLEAVGRLLATASKEYGETK